MDAYALASLLAEEELSSIIERDRAAGGRAACADFDDPGRTGRFVHLAFRYRRPRRLAFDRRRAGQWQVPASRRISASISSRSSVLSWRKTLAFSRPWPNAEVTVAVESTRLGEDAVFHAEVDDVARAADAAR